MSKVAINDQISVDDIPVIVSAFSESGWTEKPIDLFEKYLTEQENSKRKGLCRKQRADLVTFTTKLRAQG